ncbi:hypothetical protein [Nocardia arizonensis]|uniref:hypothetical protein n=1 Tax=Nocardia arizonensis TaxID=1141647 RepID=UPI0006CF2986|nr:hypothetical protein [Nocardia arizonensis]
MTDRETFAPLVFFEYDHKPDNSASCSAMTRCSPRRGFRHRAGHEGGGGYDRAGVARSAVHTLMRFD